jgi:hypothetical protein
MRWNRNDPDPFDAKRKLLEEQERALAEQRRQLSEQLRTGELPGSRSKPSEPPVWRMEDESTPERDVDPTPSRKRHLARQRQRDMILFFAFIAVLLIVIVVVLWVAYVHNLAPATSA